MKLARWAAVAVIVAISVGATDDPAAAQTPEIRTDDETLAAVAEYVDEQRTRLGIPGLALAIVVGGEVVHVAGFGEASDGTPVTGDTVFLINSMSKSITALALMQLVDAGLVDLDGPVSTYVPELAPGGDQMSVRDVMHHRSGLPNALRPIAGETDLEVNSRLGPMFLPNADYEYSNANYDTLALIVERVGGSPFAAYIEENVFVPLGMQHSAVGTERATALGPAEGHYPWLFAGYRPFDAAVNYGQVGSAAMYSSAEDIARYLMMHINEGVHNGTRVLSGAGIEVLHEPRPYDQGVVFGYGGGLFIEPANALDTPAAMAVYPTLWHDGSSPTFRSTMWMTLGPDIGMVLLANGNDVTDESWIGQISYGSRLLLSGEEPIEVTRVSDLLTRWSKWLFLAVALVQIAMFIVLLPALRRLERVGRPGVRGWVLLAAASLVDVFAAILVFVVTPAVSGGPLSEVLELPDYRILISAIIVGIGWGVVRTALAAWWLMRPRHAEPAAAATTI